MLPDPLSSFEHQQLDNNLLCYRKKKKHSKLLIWISYILWCAVGGPVASCDIICILHSCHRLWIYNTPFYWSVGLLNILSGLNHFLFNAGKHSRRVSSKIILFHVVFLYKILAIVSTNSIEKYLNLFFVFQSQINLKPLKSDLSEGNPNMFSTLFSYFILIQKLNSNSRLWLCSTSSVRIFFLWKDSLQME